MNACSHITCYASGIDPHSYSGNSVGYPCSFLASITHVPSASMRRAYGVQTLPRMIPCRAGITSSLERTGASLAGSHVAGTLESGCISQPFVIAGRSVRSLGRLPSISSASSFSDVATSRSCLTVSFQAQAAHFDRHTFCKTTPSSPNIGFVRKADKVNPSFFNLVFSTRSAFFHSFSASSDRIS